MPDVTFTINGLPYTLSAQAYTLMVRLQLQHPQFPVSWWVMSSMLHAWDSQSPFPRVSMRVRVQFYTSASRNTATEWPSAPAASRAWTSPLPPGPSGFWVMSSSASFTPSLTVETTEWGWHPLFPKAEHPCGRMGTEPQQGRGYQ